METVIYGNSITYLLQDLKGELVEGIFCPQELLSSDQGVYRIDKIVKKRGKNVPVKWKGYSDKFNTLILESYRKTYSVHRLMCWYHHPLYIFCSHMVTVPSSLI